MTKRIVIMAGGTGGHVFPALAVAGSLLEKGWQVSWLGTHKGLESRVIPEQGIAIDWLSVAGVRGKGWPAKILSAAKLIQACVQAALILRRRKPDVVLGMGGFVSGPGGLMAKVLGIPLVIHEQNRVPGTTNRLLARMANRILEAFPGSFKPSAHALCTGNPLRKQFLNRVDAGVRPVKPVTHILVVGGSQGAQILNQIVPDAVAQLTGVHIKHQTGAAMLAEVTSHYQTAGIHAEVSAFFDDMVAAYQWADMVICRAGAMTVSEVAALGLPAIFIPLPSAIDDHQTANARYLTDAGAGMLLMQKDLDAATLAAHITQAIGQLDALGAAARQCARLDATDVVARVCIEEAGL
ncbi:MAG: undecaprenyldiphospho-muramoylpentapeptide beta-N-acetylglucosaminyltransferase [Methylovulum sp.]|nr:undecaprenyldiphospho-muramoylpentapeptide beta-N-acetylglucosaminyltransferase [Methylovulum sp.]